MYVTVKTYDPDRGVPAVEGKDFNVLSADQVARRARGHLLSEFLCCGGLGLPIAGGIFSAALTQVDKPAAVAAAAASAATALYLTFKARQHGQLASAWDNIHAAMETFNHQQAVWVNPHVRMGDRVDTSPEIVIKRAVKAAQTGKLIPDFDFNRHNLLVGGTERDLRL